MSHKEENKLVWILEKANANLDVIDKTTKDYILGGIFAELGVLNNNHRIYEEAEYLPHLTYLNKKITEGRLVGELDHPEGRFDLKLQNISHRIERIDYDPVTKTVKGRVRIFDTPSGRIAKTLIDAGYPLSISSRAAGEVGKDNKVKIKKIFTFDLVADPGFESARLEIVNESLKTQGINFDVKTLLRDGVLNLSLINESFGLPTTNSNVMIYDASTVSKEIASLIESEELEETQNNNKNKQMEQYITESELDKFMKEFSSRYDTKISTLSEQLTAALEENKALKTKIEEGLGTSDDTIGKKLDATIDFIGTVLEKRIEGIINYCDENDKVRGAMVDYLSEREKVTEGIINYLDENDKVRTAIVESIDESQKVLEGTVNYIKEFETTINENFALVEGISAYAERTMQEVDCIIEYNKAIKENLNLNFGTIEKEVTRINEGLGYKTGTSLNEGQTVIVDKPVGRTARLSALNEGIEKILASVEKQKTEDFILGKKYHFFKHISESKQESFLALNETEKQKVLDALTKDVYENEAQVLAIWESALAVDNKPENLWISKMPEKAKAFWSGLNESQKDMLIKKSSLMNLNNEYQINHFWNVQMQTMQPSKPLEKLDESFNPLNDVQGRSELGYSKDVIKNVLNSLKKFN